MARVKNLVIQLGYMYRYNPAVQKCFEAVKNGVGEIPFSSQNPPVTVKANVRKINWGYEDGYETVCAKVPQSTEPLGDEEEISLYPYGCAKLRMTEIPKI